jgi:hypothetical protein
LPVKVVRDLRMGLHSCQSEDEEQLRNLIAVVFFMLIRIIDQNIKEEGPNRQS